MCLTRVHKVIPAETFKNDNKIKYGYKVIELQGKKFATPWYIHKSWAFNKWYKAEGIISELGESLMIQADDYKHYQPGFHIMNTCEGAIRFGSAVDKFIKYKNKLYRYHPHDSTNYAIARVKYKQVNAIGTQGGRRVIVAQHMCITKVVRRVYEALPE
jgi:hypothetical protein